MVMFIIILIIVHGRIWHVGHHDVSYIWYVVWYVSCSTHGGVHKSRRCTARSRAIWVGRPRNLAVDGNALEVDPLHLRVEDRRRPLLGVNV